jgi:type IV pilus assembly protein PilQ
MLRILLVSSTLLLSACIDENIKYSGKTTAREFINQQNYSNKNQFKNFVKREVVYQEDSKIDNSLRIYNQKIDFNLKKVKVKTAIELLLNMIGKSVVFDESVFNTKLSISKKQKPWFEIFNQVLQQQNLILDKSNGWIIHTQQSLLDTIENITNKHKIQKTQKTLAEVKKLDKFYIFYADLEALSQQLKNLFASEYLESNQPNIIIDKFTNSLLIKGSLSQLNMAEKIINFLDKKEQQLLLEVIIVSVGDGFDAKLATQLKVTKAQNSAQYGEINLLSSTGAVISGVGNIGLSQLRTALDILEKKSFSKILSNPKVLVNNNAQAVFIQGTQFQTLDTVTDSKGNISTVTKYKDANLSVKVTPKISKNGDILLKILVTNDTWYPSTKIIDKMEINTELLVENNKVISIGGLLTTSKSESVSKVPLLGDIPILGNLFKSTSKVDKKNELLIFIAPKII